MCLTLSCRCFSSSLNSMTNSRSGGEQAIAPISESYLLITLTTPLHFELGNTIPPPPLPVEPLDPARAHVPLVVPAICVPVYGTGSPAPLG